ncbi:MAG: DNA alkylation repair protein [Pseudomonadales bacterium]
MNAALVSGIRQALAAAADPERAAAQQAYMKSAMPYRGVATPESRRICRDAFRAQPIADPEDWQATARELWRGATYREERYAALELVGHRPYRRFFDLSLIPLLEEFVVDGAWWDYVDVVAINFVGALLSRHPKTLRPLLLAWSADDDLWRRRTAILAQLKYKTATDWRLQQRLMAPSLTSTEFFLRKALGWALREYSKTDPDAVLRYVRDHAGTLSGLTRREGLKVLRKQGRIPADDPLLGRSTR